jgi:hypothetical protein
LPVLGFAGEPGADVASNDDPASDDAQVSDEGRNGFLDVLLYGTLSVDRTDGGLVGTLEDSEEEGKSEETLDWAGDSIQFPYPTFLKNSAEAHR